MTDEGDPAGEDRSASQTVRRMERAILRVMLFSIFDFRFLIACHGFLVSYFAFRDYLIFRAEDIALSVAGVDEFFVEFLVDFVAQVGDVDVDDVGGDAVGGVVKKVLPDFAAGDDLVGCGGRDR